VPSILITILLSAHLLAMNVASAGPLAGATLAWRGQRKSAARVFRLSLWCLAVGALLGALIVAWPTEGLRSALRRFPAEAYWFAGLELLFSAACMAALIVIVHRPARRPWLIAVLAIVTAMNLLYHFPPLMTVVGELAADPSWAREEVIDRDALLKLWLRPEVLALWTHFGLASLAVACVAAMWPPKKPKGEMTGSPTDSSTRRLAAIALAATGLQIPVGLWLLSTTGAREREAILGSDPIASLCFAAGVLGALWLLQTLLAVALGEGREAITRASLLLVAVTVLMTATLRNSRAESSTKPRRDSSAAPALITLPDAAVSEPTWPLPQAPLATLPTRRREVCSA
jgi:hypothetical protein